MYGVHQIQAAWNGWQLAHRYYRVAETSALLNEVAGVAGLKVGDDVFEKLVPAVKSMAAEDEPTDAEIAAAQQSLWSDLGTPQGSYFRITDEPWGTGWAVGDGSKGKAVERDAVVGRLKQIAAICCDAEATDKLDSLIRQLRSGAPL